jgi:environmental stress-induced protein Ves
MNIRILTPANRTTINWASGTSTEIFIHPPNGSFSERNFLFRISTATVEAEESKFTFFEGITRHLMILKGELELVHEGRYTKHLKPYDQDIFSGEWETRSKGKVTDFNLMLKGGATGSLQHFRLEQGKEKKIESTGDFNFIYIAAGTPLINEISTKNGDLICIDQNSVVNLRAEIPCDLIVINVLLQ